MKCPSCASEDVVRAATFYEQASGTVSLRTSGVGVGVGGGGVGIGIGTASTSGRTASLAAQRLRPPLPTERSSFHVFVILASGAGALAVIVALATMLPPILSGWLAVALMIIALIGIIGAGFVLAARMAGADTVKCMVKDADAMSRWRRLWYCRRCGHVADQDAFDPPARRVWAE